MNNFLTNRTISNAFVGSVLGLFDSMFGHILTTEMDINIFLGWESYLIGSIFFGMAGGIIERNFLKVIFPSLIIIGITFIFFLIYPPFFFVSSFLMVGFSVGLGIGIVEGNNWKRIMYKVLMGGLGQLIGITIVLTFTSFLPSQSYFGKKIYPYNEVIVEPNLSYIILLASITGASIWFFISLYDKIVKIPKEKWQKRFSVLNRKLW